MKSLHYDQCFFIICIHMKCMHWYSLFHRDETKLTHNMEINSFLLLMQLMYKHSSPNYQHMTSHRELINNCWIRYVCVSWNIFNRIHFFAIRDALFQRFARFHATSIWSFRQLTKQLRRTIFLIIYNDITLLDDRINTTALAKQSLHHNIILEKQDHSSVGRVCTENGLPGSHTRTMFHTRRWMRQQKSMLAPLSTAIFYFFFPSCR